MDAHRVSVAVAHQEGYYVNGSIPQTANNPGDLRLGDMGFGTMGERITVFPNSTEGWKALDRQWERILGGKSPYYPLTMTWAEAGMTYSGGDPNWAKNTAQMLGVPESITLAELAAHP